MENTVDDTGGFDLREWRGEWRKEHDPMPEFRKRGWMKPARKPMPSSATAVMEHYDVTDLTFDGDRCLPVKNGLHKCVFVGAGRACDGFLRRKGDHVWLYGPDGNEWPAGTGTR